MRARILGAMILSGLLVATACTTSGGGTQAADSSSTTATTAQATTTTKAPSRTKKVVKLADAIPAAIDDIQAYWTKEMPDVYGQEYEPIPKSKILPATEDDPAPGCGSNKPDYEEVKDNAFYCPLGKYVAYDMGSLFPQLYKDYGAFAPAIVLAHEWGHAVSDQVGILKQYKTILMEQQADCFAGSWVAHVVKDKPKGVEVSPLDLQQGLAGMIQFKDPVGTDKMDPRAHGSGFDRANAFQEGFEQGPKRCAKYTEEPPDIQEIQFSSQEDLASGGNLPYSDAVEAASVDLNEYWKALAKDAGIDFNQVENVVRFSKDTKMPTCGKKQYTEDEALEHIFFCADDNYVAWDDPWLEGVNGNVGDFATAILLAKQWGASFQRQEGLSSEQIEAKKGELQQSCFAGAWAGDVARGGGSKRERQLTLSPGDLDEAVIAFLAFSDTPDDSGDTNKGTAFENTSAFRDGFFNGPVQCDSYSQEGTNKGDKGSSDDGGDTSTTKKRTTTTKG